MEPGVLRQPPSGGARSRGSGGRLGGQAQQEQGPAEEGCGAASDHAGQGSQAAALRWRPLLYCAAALLLCCLGVSPVAVPAAVRAADSAGQAEARVLRAQLAESRAEAGRWHAALLKVKENKRAEEVQSDCRWEHASYEPSSWERQWAANIEVWQGPNGPYDGTDLWLLGCSKLREAGKELSEHARTCQPPASPSPPFGGPPPPPTVDGACVACPFPSRPPGPTAEAGAPLPRAPLLGAPRPRCALARLGVLRGSLPWPPTYTKRRGLLVVCPCVSHRNSAPPICAYAASFALRPFLPVITDGPPLRGFCSFSVE
eukprot:TRINITY_DN4316_c0_g1_i3.p1 TRINITY_DN4316_c0_g1~~TRINITY_DN4316_c0_g1_i3.p1  ORF type:complete len:344 (+),score=60.99 TRINITY_DN4316_c0_g1_i3:88-1032(+)